MDDEVRNALTVAKAEIRDDANHELSFGTRKRLLKLLGSVELDVKKRHALVTHGLVRRTRLAVAAAEKVIHLWEAHWETRDPHRMLALASGYLAGAVTRDEVAKRACVFAGGLCNTTPPGKLPAFLAGGAANCAAYVAVEDEILVPEQGLSDGESMDPDDPDLYDCAYWAASAYAGATPREKDYDKNKALEFWTWYLDVAIPAAYDSVREN